MMKKKNIMEAALFLAAESGDVQRIQNLYGEDSHVMDYVTFQGDTPLHIAARKGHLHLVRWILGRKPSLAGARNKDGNMPPHEAAKNGNQDLVEFLLQRTCSCFPYNKFGETALIIGSCFPYNKFGETALIIGSKYRHVEIVNLLLTDKSTREIEWELSAREAAYRGYTDIVVAMLGNPIKPNLCIRVWDIYRSFVLEIPIPSIPKTTILHRGVQGGHLETVMAMLDHDWWKNDLMTKEDEHGRCAVHVAAMKGHWRIIHEFMNRMPACVEIRSSDHKSVLHFAVEYDQFEVVHNLLLNKDAETVRDLVSRDHDSFHNTALHLAAINGVKPQLVEYLVSFPGVDVNAVNDEDMTALDIASAAAQHNTNCAIIVTKLECVGAIPSSFIPKSITTSDPSNDSKQGRKQDIVDTHMVVASLIATVTFAAIFQIPGGIEDDRESIHYGAAKMAFHKIFRLFIFSDTAAFITSLAVVVAWLVRQYLPDNYSRRPPVAPAVFLPFSIGLTVVAFASASIIVISPRNYENLESKDKGAFSKYKALRQREIFFAVILPIYFAYVVLIGTCVRNQIVRHLVQAIFLLYACSVIFFIIRYTTSDDSQLF